MKANQVFSEAMRDFQKLLKEARLTMIIPETIDVRINVKKREVIFSVKKPNKKELN
jgi:hypothetical protein